ncbi:MAG: antifreeze protein [Phycisphaerales bacterium]|nr:antifreeze protein [Phycisphaerales bacterium]
MKNRTSRHPARSIRFTHDINRDGAPARPSVEALESRQFLSAVSASVDHGTLKIQGNSTANVFVVDQTGLNADQVRISGVNGTTVNRHAASVVLSGVTRGALISMSNADDSVTLQNASLPGNVTIDIHGGANMLTLDNVQVAGNLNVQNDSKHSATFLTDTTVARNLSIGDGNGGQNVTLANVAVGRETLIYTGDRSTALTIDDSIFDGVVRIVTGAGADAVQIDSNGAAQGPTTVFHSPVWISLSSGNDTLQLGVLGETGNHAEFFSRVHLRGGAGYDTIRNFDASTHDTRSWISHFESNTLTSDTIAPTVLASDPSDTERGVARNKKITATFSEAMDPATIIAANVTVTSRLSRNKPALAVAGVVTYLGTTMTFTPTNPLAADATFTLTITTGAHDVAANALANDFVSTFTTGSSADATAPTVTVINPTNLKTNVPINKVVGATFSESLDALTVTTATFKLTGPGNTPVTGSVLYNGASKTATFTPSSNFAPNTTYTATVISGVNGVKDLAGNALATDKVWTFTTGTQIAQAPINLRRAGPFAVMATASISSTGPTQINGDVGLNPGSAQGIPPAQVHGTIHIDDQAIINAQSDLLAAYNDAISRSVTSVSLPGNMGGLTFTPGLYTNSSSVLISGAGPANNVTLDAQGDPNAIFIFKMGSTLTTGPGAQVILAGGAKAGNIFWQVGTSATLNTTTIFKGNILASVTITVNTGSVVEGRLLGGSNSSGSVTINASTVTVPAA